MGLERRKYSVLIVSTTEGVATALGELIPGFTPAATAHSIHAAKQALGEQTFDIVIINAPLPDGDALHLAIDVCGKTGSAVLLLVQAAQYRQFCGSATEHGVFLLQKPVPKTMLRQAIDWMRTARERFICLEEEAVSMEDKIREFRLINRAKWLLISKQGMDEAEAHRHIEKQSMDRCIPRREIAEEIIQTYT